MGRGRRGAAALVLALVSASAVLALVSASDVGAQECTPLKKKACKKSPYCRFAGKKAPQPKCQVAKDTCDAVQGKKLRKKCNNVMPAGTCACSNNPTKKKGKCGTCQLVLRPITTVAEAVEEARLYLVSQSSDNQRVIDALDAAISTGDLKAAKSAYAKSRAFYERIEVAAGAFGDIDCDIDCRAYAFEFGEGTNGVSPDDFSTPGKHFKGFHRIEALMYRDGVTAPAKGFAKELKKSARDLDAKLKDKNLFDADGITGTDSDDAAVVLGNAAGLAEEIAAKKISSEEETYSDLSNVIFANNFKGIRGVVTPFKDLVKAETWAAVESALNAGDAATQGLYTDITNGETYTLYSKTSFEQRYNIQKAAYSLNAAIDNVAAELNIALPDDDPEPACTPTISKTEYPGTSAEIQGDSTSGVVYFQALAKEMETKVKDLEAKIKSGDLSAAQAAYVASRPSYEQIEVLAGSFEETDCSIDCRPDAFAKGENSPDFKGYHKIEHALFRNKSTKDAEAAAKGLVELNAKLQTELADPKNFDGVTSFEGMIGLAGEIVKKKIASEEETWSGQSLLIFDSNWDGILSQAKPFYEPAGKSPKLKELGTKVEDAIKDAKKCIDKYRKVGTTTTYDDYSTMPVNGLVDGRECVVKQGYAVMQALVDLAKEVGVFDDCSPFHHNSVYTYRHEGEHPKGETGGV